MKQTNLKKWLLPPCRLQKKKGGVVLRVPQTKAAAQVSCLGHRMPKGCPSIGLHGISWLRAYWGPLIWGLKWFQCVWRLEGLFCLHFGVCFIWLIYSLLPHGRCGDVEKNMTWDNKAVTSTQASSRNGLFSRVLAEKPGDSCLFRLIHPPLLQGEGPWVGRQSLAALDLKAGSSLLP